jgi:acyl carrier protein
MNKEQIRKYVIDSLKEFLVSDNKKVTEINEHTRPIDDLGLDSPDGIDWVCDLEEKGFTIPKDVNPFIDDKKHMARTVGEIADLLFFYIH